MERTGQGGLAFLGHEECAPGHWCGPSIRSFFLIHFVIKGKGKLITETGEFYLDSGEGFFIHPGEMTTYIADQEDPWEYLWIGVGATKENEMLLRRHGLESGVHCFVYQDDNDLIPYLRSLAYNQTVWRYEWVQGAFYFLMSTVEEITPEHSNKSDHYLQMCYDYMENTYGDELTVERLAEHLNISRSHLYRVFKSALGISPQRAIVDFRLEKASQLMEKENISLTEIALSCGFCDLSHFSKAYKEKHNRRPRREREK